jgi:hypothetical protein
VVGGRGLADAAVTTRYGPEPDPPSPEALGFRVSDSSRERLPHDGRRQVEAKD